MPLLGPLVAYLPTPRHPDGGLDLLALAALARRAVEAGVDGLGVLGSTGGFAYLSAAERADVVLCVRDAVPDAVPVLVGVSDLTTDAVLRHAEVAAAAGADALLLSPLGYLPLSPPEVHGLVKEVAAAAGLPVWVYNNPATTGVALDTQTLAALTALPGVQGMKDRGADVDEVRARVRAHREGVAAEFEIGFSGDLLGVHALLAGATTWHSGLASVLPGPYVRAARAAVAGDHDGVGEVMDVLGPVATLAVGSGGPRVVHAIGELLGLRTGRLPAPLQPPGPDVVRALEPLLDAL